MAQDHRIWWVSTLKSRPSLISSQKTLRIKFCLKTVLLFYWLFIVALTARSYRDCHWFSVLGMVLWFFLKLSSHKRDFSLSMADIYWTVSNVDTGPRPRCEQPWAQATPNYHERHLSVRVQCSHRATNDINHETRQPHLWATVWVHITLPSVGELKSPFWQQWFQFTRNIKYYINNSGIWGPTRYLPLKNNYLLSYFKIEETTKNFNQVGRATGFKPGTSRMRVSCITMEPPRSVVLLMTQYLKI